MRIVEALLLLLARFGITVIVFMVADFLLGWKLPNNELDAWRLIAMCLFVWILYDEGVRENDSVD